MIRRAARTIAVRIVACVALVATAPAAGGHEPIEEAMKETFATRADPERVTWRELRYEASKFFITAETRVTFDRAKGEKVRIQVETRALGKRTTDEIRLDARTARTLERRKRQAGKEPYAKLYRFEADEVHETRSAPADEREAEKPPAKWSERRETVHRPAVDDHECPFLADPTALLYLASARDWEIGEREAELCIYSDDTFSRMTIRAAEKATVEVGYEVGEGEDAEDHRGEVETTVLEIDVHPLDPDVEKADYKILGLKDDVRIHVDTENRLPVLITGKMDVVGRVEVELQRALLR